MAFLKPQSPLSKGNDYFYPLTTADQIIMPNGMRMDEIVGKIVESTITLNIDGWNGTKAPYTYSVSVPNLTNDIELKLYPLFPDKFEDKISYKKECAKICHCERNDSILTFECWEEKPSVDININVEMNVLYPIEKEIPESIAKSMLQLNFSVVGGEKKPISPSENTIWVNTTLKIHNVHVGKAAPTCKLTYGDIWIYTRDNGKVVFSMYCNNNINTGLVSPIAAHQYVNGLWQPVPAIIYQNKQWREWAKLPKEYQEVEFIQTSGTQRIDTGIIPNNNTYQIDTKIEVVTTTQNLTVFGTTTATSTLFITAYSSKWYWCSSAAEKNGGVYSPTIGKQYTLSFNDKNHNFLANNSVVTTGLVNTNATTPIIINARDTGTFGQWKYYYFRIINNATNEVIMDLIPCYRKSDRLAGMYDSISGKFFTNIGTGEFIVGGDVY